MSQKTLTDFPNWLSPMVVKELRQGLRTNLFTVAFILLQAFMVLCLLIGASDPGSGGVDGFFWTFVVFSLLIIQPLRGFNALSSEFKLNTMELIQLTRMDTWRITLGKWAAINAQTLLLFVSILPYLVMRYFLGGVNFVDDLGWIGMVALGSALASAITVGFSAFKSYIIRVTLLIAGYIFFQASFVSWAMMSTYGRSSSSSPGWATVLLTVFSAIYGIFFFLSLGASRIAPPSENHATRKRLVAVLFALVALLFTFWVDKEMTVTIAGIALGMACIDALTERPPIFGPVLKPFSRNFLTRWASYFLTPGWQSGIWFFAACSFAWITLALGAFGADFEDLIALLALAGTISFPLIFIHLFFKKFTSTQMNFGAYVFAQACLALLTLLVFSLANTSSRIEDLAYYFVPIPSVLLAGMMDSGNLDEGYFLIALLIGLLLSICIPAFRGRPLYREMRETFRKK